MSLGPPGGPEIDESAAVGLECRLFSFHVVDAMRCSLSSRLVRQPAFQAARRTWPSDTVLKRRRSVLFAFTFSPHLALI